MRKVKGFSKTVEDVGSFRRENEAVHGGRGRDKGDISSHDRPVASLNNIRPSSQSDSNLLSPASAANRSFNLLQHPSPRLSASSNLQINPGCDSLLLRKQPVSRWFNIPVRALYATFHFELHKFVQGSIPSTVQGNSNSAYYAGTICRR